MIKGMDDLSLPPVADFGSLLEDKQQAIRLEFAAKDYKSTTIVNIVCKTKIKTDGALRIDEDRSTIPLDRLVSHVHSLNLRRTAVLSILVLETRPEWKQKIIFSLRKLFFLLSNLPIVHLEVGAVHWSIFAELRMDFYSTFKNVHELVFLPDQPSDMAYPKDDRVAYYRTLLTEWIPRVKTTLRCLRVFVFLRVDKDLDELLNTCSKLRTITIGKLHCYRDLPELTQIQFLDLDGQGMAYSTDDLRLARHVRCVFPAARVFRVVRHSVEVLKQLLQRVIVAGGVFYIYTDLYEISHLRHIVGDTLVLEMRNEHPVVEDAYIEMVGRNSRFHTTVYFLNHRQKKFIL